MIHKVIRDPFDRLCCSCVVEDKTFIDDGRPVSRPTKIGGHFLLCGKRKSRFPFQCMVGPDWIMIVVVYVLIFLFNGIILGVCYPLGWPPLLIGLVGFVVLIFAFSSVACSDPGIIYKNDYTPDPINAETQLTQGGDVEEPFVGTDSAKSANVVTTSQPTTQMLNVPNTIECGQCDFRRPYSARHCAYCKTCCDELDHHCPWCGKCIGDKNIKAFYAFLNVLCFQFYYLLGVLIYYLIFKFAYKDIPAGPNF